MKFSRIVLFALCIPFLGACTVLGFATDLTLKSATENEGSHTKEPTDMIFTSAGAEIDAKIVSAIVGDFKPDSPKTGNVNPNDVSRSAYKGVCERKLGKDEACYSPEYYDAFRKQLSDSAKTEN